jgi:uncharacterized membrane-anchored protein
MLSKSLSYGSKPNRVPQVTVPFWIIKLLAVTMGETAADYLAVNLGLGLATTSIIMTVALVAVLGLQFGQKRYVPSIYWATVVLISVVGTLLTDNLTDNLGIPLEISTVVFSVALVVLFTCWKAVEGTLSIHSISTDQREVFYWLAILLTFALGTAAGDLVSESFAFGYMTTAGMFAAVIIVIAILHYIFNLNAVTSFWLAYIFTRPLGASIGDLLSQPPEYGGAGFGTIYTSVGFLIAIVLIVASMAHRLDKPETAAGR